MFSAGSFLFLYFCKTMLTREQILAFIRKNRTLLKTRYHIVKIGVFGSYARGEQTGNSDLDLVVEFEKNTPNLYELKLELRSFFQAQLGIKVDICREKYIKTRFRESILTEAVYAD